MVRCCFYNTCSPRWRNTGVGWGSSLTGHRLFTGDAGSGESEIRRWIIENDWLECIVALPEFIFFNTGIPTFLWILTNNKSEKRTGKVQLINAVDFWEPMNRGLGEKRRQIGDRHVHQLIELYTNFEDTEHSKIYPNEFFGYTKVTVERPLVEKREILGEDQEIILWDKRGNPKPDTALRDYERIPLTEKIDDYYQREVKPHLPDSWLDRKKDKVGYEINFNQCFYSVQPLRSLQEITQEIVSLEKKTDKLMHEVLEL